MVEAHRQLHDEMAMGINDFLQAYSNADLQVVATVLQDLLSTRKVGVRISRH